MQRQMYSLAISPPSHIMFYQLKIWLKQPYMAYTTGWHNWPLVVGSSVFIFTFLYIFEPFTIYTITDPVYKLRLILGFTVGPPFCVLFMIEVLGRIFPKIYQEKGWTVGSEILFVMGLILLIAICNFINIVLQDSDKIPANAKGFFLMVLYTAIISFFPAVAFVWFRYYRLTQQYNRPAQVVEESITPNLITETTPNPAILTLIAENGKDKIQLTPQALCYIEADDNYVTVVYQEQGKLKKELLRSSLTKIESQISVSHIRRCHRSYLVNLQKVYRVSGNAQGYKLHLWQIETPLPVSRGYAKQVIQSA
jgi:hypothetical protein